MNNQILNFFLSNHFMLRGWERTIDKPLLYKILPFVECSECEKDLIFILPSFLQSKGFQAIKNRCLIIVISNKVIVTAYWCKNPNRIINKKEEAHFQMLF